MNDNRNIDIIFKNVWNNIVLFRLIFKYVKLYNKNEKVEFKNIKSLVEYGEREYINTIIYNSNETLKTGDLPIDGVLKQVKFGNKSMYMYINGESIPYGAEVVEFCENKTTMSKLPSTIHTIKGLKLIDDTTTDDTTVNKDLKCPIEDTIPSNITSISFSTCYNISSDNGFSIPNTIKSLEFIGYGQWNNDELLLRVGDIPPSITNLNLDNYNLKNLSTDMLPCSIKQLKLICSNEDTDINDNEEYSIGIFNFMVPLKSIESLHLFWAFSVISPETNLKLCASIKKLDITFDETYGRLLPFSLPDSITKLSLAINSLELVNENVIPSSVTSLKLFLSYNQIIQPMKLPSSITKLTLNTFITKPDIFPSSLKHLKIHSNTLFSPEKVPTMLLILPESLTSITLPISFKGRRGVFFPSTIKNVKFFKNK